MTEPVQIPGFGRLGAREILKEDLIRLWEDVVGQAGLEVTTGVTVSQVQPHPSGGFEVQAEGKAYRTRAVVLAIGRRGVPRKLGIPGEDLPNVAYSLQEPEAYRGDRITVVGGGDSAVEAGLALAEQPGNEVRIAYRKGSFSRAKPRNRTRIQEALDANVLSVLWNTEIVENREGEVVTNGPEAQARPLPNDRLFVFAGGELPTPFLERCGIRIDTKFGER
jgi:thioredoxin reductase